MGCNKKLIILSDNTAKHFHTTKTQADPPPGRALTLLFRRMRNAMQERALTRRESLRVVSVLTW